MNTNTKIRTDATSQSTTQTDISKTAVYATAGAASIIGLWAIACFAGAAITTGPAALFTGWFKAVAGF